MFFTPCTQPGLFGGPNMYLVKFGFFYTTNQRGFYTNQPWGQPKYAPIPRKASKNKEEALVHMDCWRILFLRDLIPNSNHPRGAPRFVVVVLFLIHTKTICTNGSSLFVQAFLGIGAYFGCPNLLHALPVGPASILQFP